MNATLPLVTAATAASLAVLQTVLMLRVGFTRLGTQIGMGDGGNETLLKRMRAHGNLAENAALFLVLLLLAEMGGAPAIVLGPIGGAFVLLRAGHAVALSRTTGGHPLRFFGALGTALLFFGLAALIGLQFAGISALTLLRL